MGATREEIQEVTWGWWLVVLIGLVSVVIGVIVLLKPSNSLAALAVITGIFVLIFGIMEVISALFIQTVNRGLGTLIGVLSAIVGILLIRHPVKGVTLVALLLGIWLVAVGAIRLVAAFDSDEHRVWRFVLAIIEVVAGIVIVASPDIGYATLALLVGISLIANGVAMVLLGWTMHSVRRAADHPARSAARTG